MNQIFPFILCVFAVISVQGCASEKNKKALSTEQQAYLLLDQGKYSQAILFLEKVDSQGNPLSQRVELLASTYLAGAGIDLYSLYAVFQDDLLKKKADESFLDRKKPLTLRSNPSSQNDSVREGIDWIDAHLNQIKQWSGFLSHFPKISSEVQHLYLERGLRLLFAVPDSQVTRSLRLYRLLIQVVWLRQWLSDHWLGEIPEVMGLRKICKVGLFEFTSEISNLIPYIQRAELDAQILFPQSASTLRDVLFAIESMETILQELTLKELETRIRKELNCVEDDS